MDTVRQFRTEVVSQIESQYPHPLASTFRRARTMDEDDVVGRHDLLGDLFEILTKYLAVAALQDVRAAGQMPTYLQDFLRNMLHPSLGHWNEILRCLAAQELSKAPLASQVAAFYREKLSPGLRESAERLQALFSSRLTLKTHKDVFDLLILYRNKVKGHGAKISKAEYRDRLASLEACIHGLMAGLGFLTQHELMHVAEINVLPTGDFRHKTKRCVGTQMEPGAFARDRSLLPDHLYPRHESEGTPHFLDLHPLLLVAQCKDCKQEQTFVFNDFRKDRLEYLSYSCGHFLYPDMLPTEFERFFRISLSTIPSEERSAPVTDAEARERSVTQLAEGISLIASGEHYEALDHLQLSLSYQSTWDANYYLALLLMATKASPAEALFYLKSCEQLEPDRPEVRRLRSILGEMFGDEVAAQRASKNQLERLAAVARESLEERAYVPTVRTIYHYLTPRWLQGYEYPFWLALPVLLLPARAALGESLGLPADPTVMTLKVVMVCAFITTIFLIAHSMKDIYFSLAEQLVPKHRDNFPEWYQQQLKRTFGSFGDRRSLSDFAFPEEPENIANRRIFLLLFPLGVTGAVYLTCFGRAGTLRYVAELADYFMVFAFIIPGMSIVLKTFLMLGEYSRLPVKPVITQVNRYSLERIGWSILLVSVPYTIVFSSLTLVGYLTFSKDLVVAQLGLFYLMVGVGYVWTLVTPVFFSRALARAKEKVVAQYRAHLEEAFRTLVESPTEEHLKRYHWLKAQQQEVLSIGTRTLSGPVLMGILLINTYILTVAVLYPFAKFGISARDAMGWLTTTIGR